MDAGKSTYTRPMGILIWDMAANQKWRHAQMLDPISNKLTGGGSTGSGGSATSKPSGACEMWKDGPLFWDEDFSRFDWEMRILSWGFCLFQFFPIGEMEEKTQEMARWLLSFKHIHRSEWKIPNSWQLINAILGVPWLAHCLGKCVGRNHIVRAWYLISRETYLHVGIV